MNDFQFSSNNANSQIKMEKYTENNRKITNNNFKCNNADNTIKIHKNSVLLGAKVKLWN